VVSKNLSLFKTKGGFKMRNEKCFQFILCICLCIALSATSFLLTQAEASSEAPKSIKIGVPIPISGRFAAGARTLKIGYEIGADFINKSGGVYVKAYGKKLPLELIMLDDESDPVKTTSKMETLNEMHKVPAYLGGFGSSLHAAAAGVAEKNKIPYVGVAFTLYSIHQQGYISKHHMQ
jgi:ABC-type branched-subunit amino acid transport system substrate-binding protein